MLDFVKSSFNEPQARKIESVQTLWSGYGEIARYQLPKAQKTIIAKHIQLSAVKQHPRGWHNETSHLRKLSSYENELAFYQYFAQLCSLECKVPVLHASLVNDSTMCLLLEDLDHIGYRYRYSVQNQNRLIQRAVNQEFAEQNALSESATNQTIVNKGLHWLAYFHALFIEKDISRLWPIGTYWHLATRPDEFNKMPNSALKQTAPKIDNALNSAQYKTLLHGDAKLANFCFSNSSIAAVDFQYTGAGVGVKDVVYFLGSCLSSDALTEQASQYYAQYFEYLNRALVGKLAPSKSQALISEWRSLIPYAWADFERFLVGWSPGHQKLNAYSDAQTTQALKQLDKLNND